MSVETLKKPPRPIISLIAAMAKNRVIGKDNQMPWHLPADLAHFKQITLGKPVIMGRKTLESIGKPLPGRHNIVVSRDNNYAREGVDVVKSLEEAIKIAGSVEEIIIMGGGNIYEQMLPLAHRLYLTHIDLEINGDTQFPEYKHLGWQKISKEHRPADDKNCHHCTFVTLQKTEIS